MKHCISSMLDNDLYKFTMSNAYFQLYPEAEGTFKFSDRNQEVYDERFLKILSEEINHLSTIKMTKDEFNFISSIRYLNSNYLEWVKNFQYGLDNIHYSLDNEGHLQLSAGRDKMYKVTLYEVPLLAIISECRNRWLGIEPDMDLVLSILDKKIDFANENKLSFSEFGTRRRASYQVHEAVVKRLSERCHYCVGTSNVYLAMKYNMTPSGTCAHEWIMFHAGIGGFKTANLNSLNDWIKVYNGDLGISLVDTYTTASYLHTLTLKQAKLIDGFRVDSGDEFKIGDMIINKLIECRIDPSTKIIIFSNALDFKKYASIADYFKGRIKVGAGIGTNLTCDLGIEGYEPANIVIKLFECRYSPRDFWEKVIKMSDDIGKHMGDETLFAIAITELHLRELGVEL